MGNRYAELMCQEWNLRKEKKSTSNPTSWILRGEPGAAPRGHCLALGCRRTWHLSADHPKPRADCRSISAHKNRSLETWSYQSTISLFQTQWFSCAQLQKLQITICTDIILSVEKRGWRRNSWKLLDSVEKFCRVNVGMNSKLPSRFRAHHWKMPFCSVLSEVTNCGTVQSLY